MVFGLGGGSRAVANVGGLGAFPKKIFVEFSLSEVDFKYNFDVYTHAATFWVHAAMSIDSTNSHSIQLILQNSWGGGGGGKKTWTLGGEIPPPPPPPFTNPHITK